MSGARSGRQEVVIVGAGPSGLFAACDLACYGVEVRVIERCLVPHRETRATAIQPSGLEVLARAGVLASFLEKSERVRRTRFFGPEFMEIGASAGSAARTSINAACRNGKPPFISLKIALTWRRSGYSANISGAIQVRCRRRCYDAFSPLVSTR